jgi:predicted dehydrogenase
MAPLRFGLLGTGYWALQTHGMAVLRSPDAVLEGVWGRNPAHAQSVAKDLETKSYDDLDDLLGKVDAVAIAVPPYIQPGLAVRAAQAGCHLLLEKPLALDVSEAQAVVDAVEKAGVAAVILFTNRFQPAVEEWLDAAAADGKWHSANFVFYDNLFQPSSPYADSEWRRRYGVLWDLGPHMLAYIIPVMGPVRSVTAHRGPQGSDTVHLILSHGPDPQGPASAASISLTMPLPSKVNQLTFYGPHGNRVRPELPRDPVGACQNAIAELVAMVTTGQLRHRCGVQFGLEVVRVLAATEQALTIPGVEILNT